VYKTFPPSTVMMGYSGQVKKLILLIYQLLLICLFFIQSLLVIIVAILLILMSLLVLKNLGRILVQTSWKISVSCIGFSLASIAFRTFSSNFIVSSSSSYCKLLLYTNNEAICVTQMPIFSFVSLRIF
jgi:hypothetical protein